MRIKKWLSALLSAAMLLGTMAVPVFAENAMTVTTATEFTSAMSNGGSISLGNDITVTSAVTLPAGVTADIDLNGHNITTTATGRSDSPIYNRGTLTIKGVGKISGPLGIGNYGNLTIDSGTISGNSYGIYSVRNSENVVNGGTVSGGNYGIYVATNSSLMVGGGSVEGGYYAIVNNGNDTGTTITLSGGSIIGGNYGIYHPGDGTLNVSGDAYIKGKYVGVEMRGGTINVSGGTIESTAATTSYKPNSSGGTTFGTGISVSQHTTKLPISVNISGGTIRANVPLFEINSNGNSAEDLSKISLNVTGGTFDANPTGAMYSWNDVTTLNIHDAVYIEDSASIATPTFITNGTFSTEPHKYVKVNYASKKLDTSDVYNVIPLSQLVPNLNGELTIKSAIDNEKYEQVTAVMATGATKSFNISTTAGVNNTIELQGIEKYSGDILCGLIVTNIPKDVTVTITAN